MTGQGHGEAGVVGHGGGSLPQLPVLRLLRSTQVCGSHGNGAVQGGCVSHGEPSISTAQGKAASPPAWSCVCPSPGCTDSQAPRRTASARDDEKHLPGPRRDCKRLRVKSVSETLKENSSVTCYMKPTLTVLHA